MTKTGNPDALDEAIKSMSVRILYADSGRGLAIDAELLRRALERLDCDVEITTTLPWSVRRTLLSHRIAGIKKRLPQSWTRWLERQQVQLQARGKSPVDLQIHLESPSIEYLGAGQVNWLIPNQEWLRPQHLSYFSKLDLMLVKTEEAARQLAPYHQRLCLLGFSNPIAESLPAVIEDKQRFRRFLHVAGRNRKKGTGAIIDAWRRNPDWPTLDLVLDDIAPFTPLPANINHWKRPGREQLEQLHQICGIVLAPSEVEGYGHIIVEAMAQQNIVLTTDAAPMNELVTPERGYLVGWKSQQPCHFGTRYFVDADAIEASVHMLLQTDDQRLLEKSLLARNWVHHNHQQFIQNLGQQLDPIRLPNLSLSPDRKQPCAVINHPATRRAHHV